MRNVMGLGDELPHDRAFTTAEARGAGLTDSHLSRLSAAGWLRRPVRGVYVPSVLEDTLELRCSVLRLVAPEDAFLCDHTAAWLHAGDRALRPGDHQSVPDVACFRPSDGGRIRRSTVRSGERHVLASDLTEVHGIRVTTPLRTAWDIGRLARSHDVRLHGLDTMLSLDAFTHEELLAGLPRFVGERGVVALRRLAPMADGGSQSFGESALRLRWHQAGLPRPLTQLEVPGPDGGAFYLDMGLPDPRYAAEYDGEDFQSTDDQVSHDAHRRGWLSQRSWTIDVFRRDDVHGSRQTAEVRLRETYAALRRTMDRRRYL